MNPPTTADWKLIKDGTHSVIMGQAARIDLKLDYGKATVYQAGTVVRIDLKEAS